MAKKSLILTIVVCFFLNSLAPYPQAHADTSLDLPAAGSMISLSPAYQPVIIKGLTVHKDNPFLFDFIVDAGQDKLSGEPLKKEGEKLIKYFLASLAIPDHDLWVNLSPYEKSRIVPEALGQTDMGRDLLKQDYILKQITASLIYPEKQLGKTFWDTVYTKAREMYGTTQVPVNTFNKVWIMADRAEVFEHDQTAFVVDSHLKVMLEEDYLALQNHNPSVIPAKAGIHSLGSQIVRTIILPELEKEVNTGKNFANLRQIFNSLILASWYKNSLKTALINQVYSDREKIKGIDLKDPGIKERIYQRYLQAYRKGVFNFIKEDPEKGVNIPRKYFSGGIDPAMAVHPQVTHDSALVSRLLGGSLLTIIAAGFLINHDAAMNAMIPVAVPAGFGETLAGVGLKVKRIWLKQVITGKGDTSTLLRDPLAQYILASTSAAAIGSFPLRGRGKQTPKGLDIKTAGDANALHFIHEATNLFISEHPEYAVVELASEGARDGSVSSPVGRIFHKSLGKDHYVDTVEFEFDKKGKGYIKSFDKEKYISTLDRLRAAGVTILFKGTDSLEKTEGLIDKEALHGPTDSWAMNMFMVDPGKGPYRMPIDDNFRTAGISYHALNKAEDLGPLDLPSAAIPKIAKANGIELWNNGQITPEYKNFLQRVVMVTLGPRGLSLKDVDSSDERHAAIIADGLRFIERMREYGVKGMKMSPVTDGDLIARLMALAGPLELNDNKIYIEFGRSGSAEAEAARAFAKTVPGAHMVSRRVSTTATAKNVSYATADNYSDAERRINSILGYDEKVLTQVVHDEEERVPTIVGMTSVTGATSHLGYNFENTMRRVREDAFNKTITTTTLISDEKGNMYIAQVEYESGLPALSDTIRKVLESEHHAGAVFEEMHDLVPADAAMMGFLRWKKKPAPNSGVQITFPQSPAIKKEFPVEHVKAVLQEMQIKGENSGNLPRKIFGQSILRGLISEIPPGSKFTLKTTSKGGWSFTGDAKAFDEWLQERMGRLPPDAAMTVPAGRINISPKGVTFGEGKTRYARDAVAAAIKAVLHNGLKVRRTETGENAILIYSDNSGKFEGMDRKILRSLTTTVVVEFRLQSMFTWQDQEHWNSILYVNPRHNDEELLNELNELVRGFLETELTALQPQEDKAAVAASGPQDPGGIDLDPGNINWDIRKTGNGVEMDIDPALIERIRHMGVESLSPVILRITTLRSIQPLVK